jgi:DNA replication protein DnaC
MSFLIFHIRRNRVTLFEFVKAMCRTMARGKEEKRFFEEERECTLHGKYTPYELSFLGNTVRVESCPSCKEREIEEWKGWYIEGISRIAESLIRQNVPERFWFSSISSYYAPTPKMRAVKNKILEFIAKPEGKTLLFTGNPGTGKSHIGYAIYKYFLVLHLINDPHLLSPQSLPIVTSALDLVRSVKDTWYGSGEGRFAGEEEALFYYSSVGVLIIDELGVQFETQAEKLILTEIINRRYSHLRPLIAISNLSLEELSPVLGERVLDRFSEILKFDWQSWREKTYA